MEVWITFMNLTGRLRSGNIMRSLEKYQVQEGNIQLSFSVIHWSCLEVMMVINTKMICMSLIFRNITNRISESLHLLFSRTMLHWSTAKRMLMWFSNLMILIIHWSMLINHSSYSEPLKESLQCMAMKSHRSRNSKNALIR